MKESLSHLTRFIDDYGLRQPNGIVCFNARLDFYIDQKIITTNSEVHIITSDSLATVYFLGMEKSEVPLPDMFDVKNSQHVYFDKEYLKIETDSCSVLVFPEK